MSCCELLSFIRIFEIQHNGRSRWLWPCTVVNCFHLSVSLRYNTTEVVNDTEEEELWIAFIYPYLWDTTQQNRIYRQRYFSCELLSFIRIFEIQHNQYSFQTNQSRVVNCFHLSVSLRYNTTQLIPNYHYYKLWIAFIYPYLWDTTQHISPKSTPISSCELLSFIRIFEIQHNLQKQTNHEAWVVNCFHLSVSLRYNTTAMKTYNISYKLWIAFIYPYLWDTTQLAPR